MKTTGMLFNAPMVRALLADRKTQTRRVIKPQPTRIGTTTILEYRGGLYQPEKLPANSNLFNHCPYGQPGDRIWVRETFRLTDTFDLDSPSRVGERCIDAGYKKPWAPILYEADGWRRDWHHVGTPPHDGTLPKQGKTRVSIHMPRWASRIMLEIVSVRVERLQDISEADALAEGARQDKAGGFYIDGADGRYASPVDSSAVDAFKSLWDSTGGDWAANPWCWAITFNRMSP